MKLRVYQTEAVEQIANSYLNAQRRALVSMPTGTGKTDVILSTIKTLSNISSRPTFAIIVNTKLVAHQIKYTIEKSIPEFKNDIFVDTYQSWADRQHKIISNNLIVFALGVHFNNFIKMYGKFEKNNNKKEFLCYFPETHTQLVKASQFALLVYQYSLEEAVNDGYLVRTKVIKGNIPSTVDALKDALDKVLSELSNDIERKVIFACKNIKEADIIYKLIKENVQNDEVVLLTSKSKNLNQLVDGFQQSNLIRYCVGVDIVLTGIDVPQVTDIVLLKKLSTSGLLQAIAKVNRRYKKKEIGFVWDFSRNNIDTAIHSYQSEELDSLTADRTPWVAAYRGMEASQK